MDTTILKKIGLTDNEIKIYIALLQSGASTAYELSQKTGIYRVHIYDKLEQLIDKGLATYVYEGSKKFFRPTAPIKLKQYVEDKQKELDLQKNEIENILPKLKSIYNTPKEDTSIEVFRGKEGLKYFLKDIIKTKMEVSITGIDDAKYNETLPIFMEQYFRDIKRKKIKERIITLKKKNIFLFDKKLSPTTEYRFLEEEEFNPTNTFIYGDKIVIVSWGNPITATMIKNKQVAKTYRNHFEHLWKIASKLNKPIPNN